MRLTFQANVARFEADEFALVCGLAGTDTAGKEHYLNFQRVHEDEDPEEDWGVHIEIDDQADSDYNRIRRCGVSRSLLSVDLTEQLGDLQGIDGLDVILAIDDQSYQQMLAGLQRIFRGMPGVLALD